MQAQVRALLAQVRGEGSRVKRPRLAKILGVSTNKIPLMVLEGRLPAPLKLGEHTYYFDTELVCEHLARLDPAASEARVPGTETPSA